ncbi:hypothetical protein FO519_002229 [Halicephalobus sp. NKZ332]|nr:hypothetical protein FO519_002229 [Halicephalobus sp. NKZ332]
MREPSAVEIIVPRPPHGMFSRHKNPITLTGSDFSQFIYSPYDERKNYPPNTDCRFLLLARSPQRRIHITVIESVLEEPLFTDCEDYVSVRDGNQPTSEEIHRWCGTDYPTSITSSRDSLYVHFHSDSIIQKRGFNMSFIDFDLPGCPPEWESDAENEYCYKLFLLPYGATWIDAQKACNFERSNLLTISSNNEYTNVVKMFSQQHTFPWIGYNDAENEGYFQAVNEEEILWPEKFPTFSGDHTTKDCVYMNWNINDGMNYVIDDCRSRHSFICKKHQDGSTIPVAPPTNLVRNGLHEAGVNNTIWLLILALIVLLLIILLIVYMQFKKRYNNRVANVDMNQRLVEGSQASSLATSKTEIQTQKNTRFNSGFPSDGGTATKINKDQKFRRTSSEKKNKKNDLKEKNQISHGANTDSENSARFEMNSNQQLPAVFSKAQDDLQNLNQLEKQEMTKDTSQKVQETVIQMNQDTDGGSDDYMNNQPVVESDNPEDELGPLKNDKHISSEEDITRPESEVGVIAVDETESNEEKKPEEQLAKKQEIKNEGQAAPITTGLENLTRPTFPHSIAIGIQKDPPVTVGTEKMNEEVQTEVDEDPLNMSMLSEDFDGMQMPPMNPHTQKKQKKSHMHILSNVHAKTEEEFWG